MNLWIDDCKPEPDGWARARTFEDAVRMLRRFPYEEVAVDHDLAGPETGYDLLCMMERGELPRPQRLRIISLNPVGVARMKVVAATFGIPVSVWSESLPIVGAAEGEE